ncbi:MAG: MerR family transcriptional regulator, partial [Saccharofermentans sp.]|nr:MerR family transcriptional regulator [Saccharofermentans sp.]
MDEKMTSGEIAKKAGVSRKAIRLYDEKGLLKPTDYSEGNYRLYDKEALVILEKIVALKQIGFSLEEIRDNLTAGDAKDIEEALRMQLAVMEEKRYRIEMVIDAINRTLARNEKDLDWDDVANIVQSVTVDQNDDRNHWLYLKHTLPGEDWYVNIFRSMDFEKDRKV